MNREGMIRTGKVFGMVLGAVVVLLVLRLFLGSIEHQSPSSRRDSVITALVGDDPVIQIERDDLPADVTVLATGTSGTDIIVIRNVAGYQSRIEVAYRFDTNLTLELLRVVDSTETPPIDRILVEEGVDGLSGATVTAEAINGGVTIARRYAELALTELE